MKNRLIHLFSVIILSLLLASCSCSKKLAYLQTLKGSKELPTVQAKSEGLYEARIKPKDLLTITVITSEPDASKNYNLIVPQVSSESNRSLYSSPNMQTYLVDNDGNIDFPILGKLMVAGNTRKELEAQIQKKLEPAFSNEHPVITIRIINYDVDFLGEVVRPGRYSSENDRLTIFDGLAMAGDMTIYGKRDNVKVLRENIDGSKTLLIVDLNDKNIFNSPAYYLEQNDIVYVEPNKARTRSSNINSAETLMVSGLSIAISLASLLVNILR